MWERQVQVIGALSCREFLWQCISVVVVVVMRFYYSVFLPL